MKFGKACPDIPIHDFAVFGLPQDGPYLEYQVSRMNTAPSCSPYPETTYTFTGSDSGDCPEDLCNYGGQIRPRKGSRN